MRVSKQHPQLGWLRLEPGDYSRSLDRLLQERDADSEPNRSGPAPGYLNWVWTTELPGLLQHPRYRQQFIDRLAELSDKDLELAKQFQMLVGSLSDERDAIATELQQLREVLQ